MEKRNLHAAYRFYCHKELIGAHNAMVDAQATLDVLEAQIAHYAQQPVTNLLGQKLGMIENDLLLLHVRLHPEHIGFFTYYIPVHYLTLEG